MKTRTPRGDHVERSTRSRITRETLLADIVRADPDARETAETLLDVAKELGGYVSLGDASASVKVRNSTTHRPCTLFVVTRNATFYIGFLSHWVENTHVAPDLRLAYTSKLTEILGKNPLEVAIPLMQVARQLNEVLATVRGYTALLRAAGPAATV